MSNYSDYPEIYEDILNDPEFGHLREETGSVEIVNESRNEVIRQTEEYPRVYIDRCNYILYIFTLLSFMILIFIDKCEAFDLLCHFEYSLYATLIADIIFLIVCLLIILYKIMYFFIGSYINGVWFNSF